tara:strand:- start:18870 stop:19439 length:570 start_codon:yes stop_codon:yes gene_type:complete
VQILDKWADRIYSETDVSRSVATSSAGVIGLIIYLKTSDWGIAAFTFLIVFPIVRLLAASKHERLKQASDRQRQVEQADELYGSLSPEEQALVDLFVENRGCVMTWGRFNRSDVSSSAVETLIQRELLSTSVTADGMTETFVLDVSLFDAGVRRSASAAAPTHRLQLTGDACGLESGVVDEPPARALGN